jgi:hypothetical protein
VGRARGMTAIKTKAALLLYAAMFIVVCDATFLHFRLISLLMGEDVNRAEINLFGRTISAQFIYALMLSVIASALGFAWRKKGRSKENLLFSVFYGLIAVLLLAYLVLVYSV